MMSTASRPQRRPRTRSSTSRRRWPTTTPSRPTPRCRRRSIREGGEWGLDRVRDFGAVVGLRGGARARQARPAQHPGAAHPRPLRQPRRRDRLRPVDALDAAPRRRARGELAAVARAARRAPTSCGRACSTSSTSSTRARAARCRSTTPRFRRCARTRRWRREWEERLTLPDYDRFAQAGMVFTEKQGGSDLRANSTVAEPIGDGWYRADRPQVVLHPPGLRRLLHARPDRRRDHLLRRQAAASGLSHPAPEGQARGPLPGLLGGRVRPPARADARRGGARHGVHRRAADLDAPGHADRRSPA